MPTNSSRKLESKNGGRAEFIIGRAFAATAMLWRDGRASIDSPESASNSCTLRGGAHADFRRGWELYIVRQAEQRRPRTAGGVPWGDIRSIQTARPRPAAA